MFVRNAARTGGLVLCAGATLASLACAPGVEPADLVLTGGKIVTMDETHPEAEALAVRGDTLVAVGSAADIEPYIGAGTEVIGLDGKLAIPGFIEGHGHFLSLGRSKLQLELGSARTWDEIVIMVKEAAAAAPSGSWILGRGWHQEMWDEAPKPSVEGLPVHTSLSAASPENPVFLTHKSGHAGYTNAVAMKLAGIDRNTPNPSGGEIVRDGRGEAIGVLRETAQGLVGRVRDSGWNDAQARREVELASQECLEKGITSFQDAGSSLQAIDLFKELAQAGELGVRLWVMIRVNNDLLSENLAAYRVVDFADHHLTVRAIKRAIDGALGSHGAWLLDPYTDLPGSSGLNTTSLESLQRTAELALEHEYQLCVHAIGDRGNHETLNLFENAFANAGAGGQNLRWRIEHAQHLHPDDIPRFAELGVVASMQGVHCTSDGPWVPLRLGEKRAQEGAYLWRTLLDSGAVVSNGTDAPVEDVSPLASFYSTVSRRLGDGSVFYPDQRLSREEALRTYTLAAAEAAFEEEIKGSLKAGKLADITVLSQDIMTIPEEGIPATEVLYTIVGGEVRYRNEPEAQPSGG